jgi:2'-5' RNA ligase
VQKIGSRPHLSLLILDECNIDHVANLIDHTIKSCYKFPITFPAFSLIPGDQQAVFLTPAMNSELIEMQLRLYNLLEEMGYSIRKYYKPHNWLPHCSISKELSPAESLKTLEVCQVSAAIGETLVTDIGFIEFRPRKVIRNYRLNGL